MLQFCVCVWKATKSKTVEHEDDGKGVEEQKKTHKNKEIPQKSPQLGSDPKILFVGVLFLENKTEEAPPHKELGLSNLYAADPFNSLCGYSLCAFFTPQGGAQSNLSGDTFSIEAPQIF